MAVFQAKILKFGDKGEKTGWRYIVIPPAIAKTLSPHHKKSFRVKGSLDKHSISRTAVMPMGDGKFIMSVNSVMRKGTGKDAGAILSVSITIDNSPPEIDCDFLICLKEDDDASAYFESLAPSHQNYFSTWISSAKTSETKDERIVKTLNALRRKMKYSEMLREGK